MNNYTEKEWREMVALAPGYFGKWEPTPFNLGRVEAGELPADYIGKRNMLVYEEGHGTVLLTEGVHFTIGGKTMYPKMNDEELVKIIERFAEIQREGFFPCPRCGRYRMDRTDPIRNALSRHAEIQVCDPCGTEEAILDFTGSPMPLKDWAIARSPETFIRD